jgi:hypothetical protein
MAEKTKQKPAYYTIDFVTALPKIECLTRLDQRVILPNQGLGASLAPMRQETLFNTTNEFVIERSYLGAIVPIRLVGYLDEDENSKGTWVHGTITHDVDNQVLIEGLIVFLLFFLMTALLFLRLKLRGLAISVPMLLVLLLLFSARWRVLRASTLDLTRWVRRKLYVTREQVK